MKTNNQETAIALQGETSMGDLMTFAKTIAASGLIPDAYRGKPADILVTLVTGRELGISPMQSLRGIHTQTHKHTNTQIHTLKHTSA